MHASGTCRGDAAVAFKTSTVNVPVAPVIVTAVAENDTYARSLAIVRLTDLSIFTTAEQFIVVGALTVEIVKPVGGVNTINADVVVNLVTVAVQDILYT